MPTSTFQLFLSMMRNARSYEMNRSMIGYSVEHRFPPITRESIAEFARATCDDNPSYYSDQASVPPFFVGKLIIPLIKNMWAHTSLRLNLLKTVQISQSVTWLAPVRQGDELSVQVRIQDIFTTAGGEILELSGTAVVGSQVVLEGTIGFLVKSKTGTGNHKATENKPLTEACRLLLPTAEGQQLLYARASGDNNFIHTSPFLARMAGLPRTVMQGACALAMICGALTKHFVNNDISRVTSVAGQFGKPILPGETLSIIGYHSENDKTVPFSVLNDRGKHVFREGVFTIKRA
ncbi:MAG: MaoC family dehydratase N-terminal domain-containing protein [Desulfomonile tiedjei]|uniref:MaoC family dehydratase N-terminal domain-containing protein n=1 Tax=Desulfomonile tiedjei TaxID=2358 RepID=A0A9D6Z5C4_9BACT|nr:MaoC family dehydratase N-terminal domain-containing protein [Desulfomonile tiedjei]